ICYLDRGIGAAIRRAHTRLPGGDKNPLAIIRIPRERMVGCGIASSLVHEVGHQASVLLELNQSLLPLLKERQKGTNETAWKLFERWLSEILADFWAIAKLGITATSGLMAVLSLPRAFVFRCNLDDPHPFPYIRVKISCAIGKVLYPYHPWERLYTLWENFYPLSGVGDEIKEIINTIESNLSEFVEVLVNHCPKKLKGASLKKVRGLNRAATPEELRQNYKDLKKNISLLKAVAPCFAFTLIGIAKVEGLLKPEEEGEIINRLLKEWAINRKIQFYKTCILLKK
ncbi:MAG: hypothetical protein N2053_11145, partial [Chitinispirillaceae bacterium]|nr:hypothetical protein [Chitinispirillaceae bacterium]